MKQRPILFSGPMVRAILERRKKKTRRIMNPQPDGWIRGNNGRFGVPQKITTKKPHKERAIWQEDDGTCYETIKCRYGEPGDQLWVRETWAQGQDLLSDYPSWLYRADLSARLHGYDKPGSILDTFSWDWDSVKWKPNIFMPRDASRILLEVVDIHYEPLQDISEEDALLEGVEPLFSQEEINTPRYHHELNLNPMPFKNYLWPKYEQYSSCKTAKESFVTLWDSINGVGAFKKNPVVTVLEFEVIED